MRTQLNQSELETLFDLSHDLLCIANVNGFFHCVNPAFNRVLGYEKAELLDRPFIDFVHPDDRQPTLRALEELSMGKTVVWFENRYRCKNGEYKILQWNATPDQGSDYIAATARDITVENTLRTEVENSRNLRALGTVATTIAHDMNNLLEPIVSMSEVLLEFDGADSKQANFATNMILASAERAADLVKQILSFSEDTQASFTAIRIEPVIHEVIKGMGSDCPVNVTIEPGVRGIHGDSTQLFQLVVNLCCNANQAKSVGSALQVNLFNRDAPDGQHVVVEVINDGAPIPEVVRDRMFEPFFTTRKGEGGHGLGLAIVNKIVKAHDGTISVLSDSSQTKFVVAFPAIVD